MVKRYGDGDDTYEGGGVAIAIKPVSTSTSVYQLFRVGSRNGF
jgi:hypothetical protein